MKMAFNNNINIKNKYEYDKLDNNFYNNNLENKKEDYNIPNNFIPKNETNDNPEYHSNPTLKLLTISKNNNKNNNEVINNENEIDQY